MLLASASCDEEEEGPTSSGGSDDAAATTESIEPRRVPSASMPPTFEPGQIVDVDVSAYAQGSPELTDVVVYHPPAPAFTYSGKPALKRACAETPPPQQACSQSVDQQAEGEFLGRVVAGPGDRLRIRDGLAVVGGAAESGDFAMPCRTQFGCQLEREFEVPRGEYYILGDLRRAANDSRFWGPVPEEWIVGRVVEDG